MAMAMGVGRVAKAVPAVAIAAVTGALLLRNADEGLKMLERGCPDRAAYSWRSNVPVIDKFLCVMVNFFVHGVRSDEGKVATGYVGTLLVSVMAFMAVEGSRLTSSLALSATWVHAVLLQITGVSVSFPGVWLPVYFLSDGGNREQGQIHRKKVSLFRVAAVAVAFLALWLNLLALFFPLSTDKKQSACLIFLAMPAAVTVAYLPFQTHADAPQQKGHKGVVALHLLQAGFALTWHLVAVLFVVRDPAIPGRIARLFGEFRNEEWPVYFLLVDFVSLFLSFLYLTAVEDGALIALLELVGGVLFGPAFAVSAYCVYREQSISKSVSRVRNKTKEN